MKNRLTINVVLLGLFVFPSTIWAGVPENISADGAQVTQWVGEQLSTAWSQASVGGPLVSAEVHSLLGVEVGVTGLVSSTKLDVGGFRALSFTALNNKSETIDLPDSLPLPLGFVHAKVGLPLGVDVGAKYGYTDFSVTKEESKFSGRTTLWGVEVRKVLLGGGLSGAVMPQVSASVGYDRVTGNLTRSEPYNALLLDGITILNSDTEAQADYSLSAVTARVLVSKKFLFITPFAGAGYSRFFGDTHTSYSVNGQLNPGGNVSVASASLTHPDQGSAHGLAGLEVSPFPFLSLQAGYLFGKDHWAGQFGLKASFR